MSCHGGSETQRTYLAALESVLLDKTPIPANAALAAETERNPIASPSGAARKSIILVGNHNVGKSLIFGWLTGTYVTVANYPGTTVELTRGACRLNDRRGVIDTPGVNSLHPISEDERVTRDVLLNEPTHVAVQVADAKNLRRALLITSQLAEFALPVIIVLNMMDEARSRDVHVDAAMLSVRLGAPVIPTTATRREGLAALADAVETPPALVRPLVHFDERIETAVAAIADRLAGVHAGARGIALMFLSDDPTMDEWIRARLAPEAFADIGRVRAELQAQSTEPLSSLIQQQRTRWIDGTIREVYRKGAAPGAAVTVSRESLAQKLGRWSVHPIWGVPILLFVLFLLYEFVGRFGAGTLVGFVEGTVFDEWINPVVRVFVEGWIPFAFVRDLLIGQYGLLTVALTYGFAIILPIVLTFFIAFGILEDSGYLPRLAVMADRVFKSMGLNGKAVLPMVLGLGCDTMATMTTRTLETKKDRILVTLLLALGVPCSAQLGVVLGMLAGLGLRATLIWTAVIIVVMLAVGWLAARVIPGASSDFILELPPLRVPGLSHIVIKTMARLEWYLKEVMPLFVLGTLIVFALDKTGALTLLKRAADPLVVNWLGLPSAATESFLIGFLRRDYGAAGFFMMAQHGQLTPNQILVALVTITLFVPCIANFFVMIKERGLRTALAMTAFIFPFAFFIGGVLNWGLRLWN